MRVRPVIELLPRTVNWLWPGRLARGKLAMLDGDPGLGKSLLTLDLAARLSAAQPLPDDFQCATPVRTLVLNGEDGPEDTIRPRLHALGADLNHVFVMQSGTNPGTEPITFPSQLDTLHHALRKSQAQLLVIDPILAFLDRSVFSGIDQSVRRALTPLAQLAEHHGCAVLMVRHLTKSRGVQSLYRGAGSIGFVGACRSGWLVALHPDMPQGRVLAQVKNNLAPPQPSLWFEVQQQAAGPPTLAWRGNCPLSAEDLLDSSSRSSLSPMPRDRARDLLAAFLEDGPRTSREVWAATQEHHLTDRTVYRAKGELGILTKRINLDGRQISYWHFPNQKLPDSVPPDAVPPDLEEWLAPLRAKYPPATPLDDL